MSVTYGIDFVDWERFKAHWRQSGGKADFYNEAMEVGPSTADWFIPIDPKLYLDTSFKRVTAFSECFHKLSKFLDPAEREQFETFFLGFCLIEEKSWRFHTPHDLGDEVNGFFFSTIAPETVRYFLELWEHLDLEKLRPAFARIQPEPFTGMDTFEDFKRYAEMWGNLLRDAVAKKAGIVTTAE